MNRTTLSRPVAPLIPLLIVLNFILFILFRKVNLDEGWYLWASKLVYQGQILYRDFTYTQTPLLPYVYGAWQQVAGEGLLAGRILTSLFGILTAGIGALVVRKRFEQRSLSQNRTADSQLKIDRRYPLFAFGLLFGTSVYAIAYLTYTATYGLACLLLVSAFYFALGNRAKGPYSITADGLTIGLLCLAAATRLSTLPALPVFVLYLLWRSPARIKTFVTIVVVTGIAVVAVSLLAFVDGSQMVYDIFGFHTDRTPSMVRQFWRMVDTTRNTAFAYGVPIALIALGGVAAIFQAIRGGSFGSFITILKNNDFEIALLVGSLGSFFLHLWPRTTDAYYNTLLFPTWLILASLVLGYGAGYGAGYRGTLWNRFSGATVEKDEGWNWGMVLLGCIVGLNFLLQAGAVRRNDLFRIPPIDQLKAVANAATFLEQIDRSDNQVLTLNTHLALESGMVVPPGYEMSIFAYRPDWATEQAEKFKVVNNQILIDDLAAGVDAVAITDFDLERFYGERQNIFDTLNAHYRLSKVVPNFDPFYNELYIYLPPQFENPKPDNVLEIELENDIWLLGYDVDPHIYQPGDKVYVGLYWKSARLQERTYTVFMHLLNEAGEVVYGWDNPPCRTTCPTTTWQTGEIIRDGYTLEIPPEAPDGGYRIRTGMYNSDTGNGIPSRTKSDAIQDNRLIILDEILVKQ